MRLSGHFLIFLRKILPHKKRKTSNIYSLKIFCSQKKICFFVVFYSFIFVLLVGFCLFCVFYAAGFFLKEIRNCPDNLIYHTTDVYLLSTTLSRIIFLLISTNFTLTYSSSVCNYFHILICVHSSCSPIAKRVQIS